MTPVRGGNIGRFISPRSLGRLLVKPRACPRRGRVRKDLMQRRTWSPIWVDRTGLVSVPRGTLRWDGCRARVGGGQAIRRSSKLTDGPLIRLRHLLPQGEKAMEPRVLSQGLLPLWE